jgi:hypothetical protein
MFGVSKGRTEMTKTIQIVLARIEEETIISELGQIDIGRSHKFKTIPKPVALMWLGKGKPADVEKAEQFAATAGYRVFCYSGERDPLGKARQQVLAS